MKVFVAGATGVVGRRAVVELVGAGHEVTAVARSAAKATWLRGVGATPVEVSLFDPAALRTAVTGHDAVVNLATHIPSVRRGSSDEAWAENARIRTEGSTNLVDAALAAGASVYVQEALGFWYEDRGDGWIDESAPLVDSRFNAPVRAAEANTARFAETGGTGVVLRFGRFYAPDSHHTRLALRGARLGISPELGPPEAFIASISGDDAASAVVAALDAPSGVYNIVDDEPLTGRDADAALAGALGRKSLRRLPRRLADRNPAMAELFGRSQRVSNRRFREATGWAPVDRSVREGWTRMLGQVQGRPMSGVVKVLLALLVVSGLAVGLQAQFFPRSFYDDFPFGRGWVAADGPYNEHLVRDVGGLNLALAAVSLAALAWARITWARLAAVAWLIYGVPHFVYHLGHLQGLDAADKVGEVASLGLGVVLATALLVAAADRRVVPAG
jgi:nucleoside-diphosphate-sugar epimerase